MLTRIKSLPEEQYSDNSRLIGVLFNYTINDNQIKIFDSFYYIFNFKEKTYIFFNTIIDLVDYLIYSQKTMKRAYMKEDEFDVLYDSEMNGLFNEQLKWL